MEGRRGGGLTEMESLDASRKATCLLLLLLIPIFFFLSHELDYSYEGGPKEDSVNYAEKIDYEERALEGNSLRRAALFSLGSLSLLGLIFTRRRNRIRWDEPLGWALLFFGAWSLASIVWSIDIGMTARKLSALGIFCLAAMAMTSRFSVNFAPEFVFFLTAIYLVVGLAVEIVSRTFEPFSGDYRFSGTIHPNVQGINCTMMLLAAVSLAGDPDRRRGLYLAAAAGAFVFLMLTKSRTAFACALLVLAVHWIMNSSNKLRVSAYLLGILCVFSGLYLFLGDILITNVKEGALMGRESEETLTLTGRTFIWETSLNFIDVRPLQGHGFNSFWIPRHIRTFTEAAGWNISDVHSVYIDLVLGIGLVGLLSYLLTLFLGMKSAFSAYLRTGETGYGFLLMILIFFSVHGLMESALIQISSLESFVFIWALFSLAFLDPDGDREMASRERTLRLPGTGVDS